MKEAERYECSDGTIIWTKNGKLHRENSPAVEYRQGGRDWFINGKRHREDGAAIEFPSGNKEWYLHGKQLTEDEFLRTIKQNLNEKLHATFEPRPKDKKNKI